MSVIRNQDYERAIDAALLNLEQFPDRLPANLEAVLEYAPDGWEDPDAGRTAAAIRKARRNGGVDAINVAKHFAGENGLAIVSNIQGVKGAPTLDAAEDAAANLLARIQRRLLSKTLREGNQALKRHPQQAHSIAERIIYTLDGLRRPLVSRFDKIRETRRFDPNVSPPEIRPIFRLAGRDIGTPGNITTLSAAVKVGKSAAIGAMVASALAVDEHRDTFTFESQNPLGHALIWLDSEQALDDFWNGVARVIRRAGINTAPPWLRAYCLTGLGHAAAWEFAQDEIRLAAKECGGIHSVFLDGSADFVADVNDPEESNDFVAKLHGIAIEHACSITNVIHTNPNSDKTRGHLGSQLERKAESNLCLEKVDDVTTIFSVKQRRAPIPKGTGPCFRWDDEAGMHVSTTTRNQARDTEKAELGQMLAEDMFASRPAMRYSDAVSTIMELLEVSTPTANRKLREMLQCGAVKKTVAGLYVKGT